MYETNCGYSYSQASGTSPPILSFTSEQSLSLRPVSQSCKAREIYTQLSLEQSSDYDKVKELTLNLYVLVLKLTGINLEIVEKNMTRLTWNLLEQKYNYLICVALQRT